MVKQKLLLDALIDEQELTPDGIVQQIAALTRHTQVGKCEQMAWLAFVYLRSLISDTRIELVTTSNHMFVVINRETESDIRNTATWGEKAIICDPWARRSYNAQFFNVEKHLYRPAAPEDIYSEGSYLKGPLALYHSYEPEQPLHQEEQSQGPSKP